MTSPAATSRRSQLLDATVDWVIEHGLAALTLRPLAAALNTSDRMLVYHFGSKDALVDEVIDAINGRLLATLALPEQAAAERPTVSAPFPTLPPSVAVLAAWQRLSAPTAAPYLRFLAEVSALGVRDPARFATRARAILEPWVALVAPMVAVRGESDAERRALATAVVAALYTLAVDIALLGERTASDEAAGALARLLDR